MPTYGPISSQTTVPFADVFEESDYDNDLFLTKETFKHSEPGLAFSYKYGFRVFEIDDGRYATELFMAILPSSMCKAKREEIAAFCGIEESQVTLDDAIGTVMCATIPFAQETVEADKLDEAKDGAASALPCFNSLRGFYLDRAVNRIGVTGWDLIKEAKGKIKDAITSGAHSTERRGVSVAASLFAFHILI